MGLAKKSKTAMQQASKRSMAGLKSLASGLKSSFMMALVVVASATTPSCCKPQVACDFEQPGTLTEAVDIVSKRDDEKDEAAATLHDFSELTGANEIVVEHHAATHKAPTKLDPFYTTSTTFVEAPPPAVLLTQSSLLETCYFDASENFDCADIDGIEAICSTTGIAATVPDNDARLSSDTAQAVKTAAPPPPAFEYPAASPPPAFEYPAASPPPAFEETVASPPPAFEYPAASPPRAFEETAASPPPAIVGDGGWTDNKLLIRSLYLEAVRRATGSNMPSKSLLGLDSPFTVCQPSLSSTMVAT